MTITNKKYNSYFSASVLKTLAMVFMFTDHLAALLLFPKLTSESGLLYSCYTIMRIIGRLSFPLFSFMLTEGFRHSRNRLRYLVRLSVTAIISEPVFNYSHSGSLFYPEYQNVFFTLALSLLMLLILEKLGLLAFTSPLVLLKALPVIIPILIIGCLLKTDYGVSGPIIIIGIYYLTPYYKNRPLQMYGAFLFLVCISNLMRIIMTSPGLLFSVQELLTTLIEALEIQLYAALSAFIISAYNEQKGRQLNRLFYYAFYPLHLLLLGLIKYMYQF